MTTRLYYTDPYRTTFDAVVQRALEHDGRPAVILDCTAFYPTSGGQPFDTGRLGTAAVEEVIDAGDEIIHVLSERLAEGTQVAADVDWPRRFDHMQQHTGQHVLSAAIDRLFDTRTLSFHLGTDTSTIDLAREMSQADIDRAVAEANRVVWDDRPVTIRFVSEEEAARLALRKEPPRQGTLRLIEIADFDLSACGGTHVSRTGAIGLIAVTGSERVRGGSRLTFVCGGRALSAFQSYCHAVAGTVRLLSVLPHELPSAVERLQADARDLRRTVSRLRETVARHEAVRLLGEAVQIGDVRVAAASLDGWEATGLKSMASTLTAGGGVVAVLTSTVAPLFVAVGRSADVRLDAGRVLKELIARFGGRGGGRPELAQGGGLAADGPTVVAAAREFIERERS